MKFKDLFDKEVLMETSHIRKELKIFYELNLNLIKASKEEEKSNNTQQSPIETNNNQQAIQAEPPMQQEPIQQQAEPVITPPIQGPVQNEPQQISPAELFSASVVTEDDEKLATDTKEKIERKFSGEIKLSPNQKDNIQSISDIIEILSDTKKDGTPILDEFSAEIINLCASQNYQQIKTMLDKKSKIFIELYYGYTKFDSIGLRFNKHTNADILTSTMLLDNNILNAKFSIDKINEKIAEFRNYEAEKLNK